MSYSGSYLLISIMLVTMGTAGLLGMTEYVIAFLSMKIMQHTSKSEPEKMFLVPLMIVMAIGLIVLVVMPQWGVYPVGFYILLRLLIYRGVIRGRNVGAVNCLTFRYSLLNLIFAVLTIAGLMWWTNLLCDGYMPCILD